MILLLKYYNFNGIIKSTKAEKNGKEKEEKKTMNKTELIEVVAQKADLSKKAADAAVNAVIAAIEEALVAGEKVQLIGFGTIEVKAKAARTGRNPSTGAEISIPASKQVKFSAGKTLKDKVNA